MREIRRSEFIEAFPAFAGDTSLVDDVLKVSRVQAFPAACRIYSAGDPCQSIALLLSGEIRVYKSGESGREITLYEIGRGETCILNASCVLSNIRYPADATSTEGGEALMIPAADFRRLLEKYPAMRGFIYNLFSARLAAVMELVEEVAFARMDERLMDYLIEKSEDGRLAATHQKIADDLGTSREVVSRLLKDFERKGHLSLARNSITLLTLPK